MKRVLLNNKIILAEWIFTLSGIIWCIREPAVEPAIGALSFFLIMSAHKAYEEVNNNSSLGVKAFDSDEKLFKEIIATLPYDHQMKRWLKEQDLLARNLKIDYFEKLESFLFEFEKETKSFHDKDLDQKLNAILANIRAFSEKTSLYLTPSPGSSDRYQISRHSYSGVFDPKKDEEERRKSGELNRLATAIFESYLEFFSAGKGKFKI